MRRFAILASSVALLGVATAGTLLYFDRVPIRSGELDLPAVPAPPTCHLGQAPGSREVSPDRIRKFEIAGVHIGMDVKDAVRALRDRSSNVALQVTFSLFFHPC